MTKLNYQNHTHKFQTDLGWLELRGQGNGDIELELSDGMANTSAVVIIGPQLAGALALTLLSLLEPVE